MEKKVAVSLAGVLVSSKPWREAHEIGMRELAEKAGMPELLGKTQDKDYFDYVKKALGKIDEYKDLPEEERIAKRRRVYFDRVLDMIGADDVRKDVIDFLRGLKCKLVLITTNDEKMAGKVLEKIGADDLFDEVFTSESSEKDDKRVVFERLIEKIGKPSLLIERSGKLKEFCEKSGVLHIKFDSVEKLKEEMK